MFPLRYWANRFFNPRYWPVVGAEAAQGAVGQRFDLEGTHTNKFTLIGTTEDNPTLIGTSTKKFTLKGS